MEYNEHENLGELNLTILMENKNQYQTFVINTLRPIIYDIFRSMYNKSKIDSVDQVFINKGLSLLQIFQMYLLTVKEWSSESVNKHSKYIYSSSGYSTALDVAIKAIIKSKIITMRLNLEIDDEFHKTYIDDLNINNFFHKCFIECAKDCYNYANFFLDEHISAETYKINEYQIENNISKGIIRAIDQSIPIEKIGSDFLKKKFVNPPPAVVAPPVMVAPPVVIPPPVLHVPAPPVQMMVPEHMLEAKLPEIAPPQPIIQKEQEPVNVNINVNPIMKQQRTRGKAKNEDLNKEIDKMGKMMRSMHQEIKTEKDERSERSKSDNPFVAPNKKFIEVYGRTPKE